MQKTELIRLANVLGMDIDNNQDKVAVYDALSSVSVPSDFIEWMREKRDTVEYANRREKLTILLTRYKKTVDNIPIDTISTQTQATVNKFGEAISFLRDNEEKLDMHLERLQPNKVQWFTNNEIERLMAIGGLRNCINAYEEHKLYDNLYEVSVKRYFLFKKQEVLTDGQKKVKALIGEVL